MTGVSPETSPEFTSPDRQIERIRNTVNSMQRRIRALDSLMEEQIRTLDLERDLFRPPGIVINHRYWRILQAAAIVAAILSFTTGFVAGYQRLGQ